jgi:hypothetical protein
MDLFIGKMAYVYYGGPHLDYGICFSVPSRSIFKGYVDMKKAQHLPKEAIFPEC